MQTESSQYDFGASITGIHGNDCQSELFLRKAKSIDFKINGLRLQRNNSLKIEHLTESSSSFCLFVYSFSFYLDCLKIYQKCIKYY